MSVLRITPIVALFAAVVLATQPARLAALRVEILTSLGGLPPHVSGVFEEPTGFQQAPGGDYFVFDRRGHSVYRVPPDRGAAQRIISIGQEDGRVIDPTGFDMAADGRIVVADAPRGRQRIQVFDAAGTRLAGFFLQGQPAARIVMGGMMLNGTGSIQFSGRGLLVSHPESGALITTYSIGGYGMTTIGNLRPSGFEQDRELHLAMNAGFPLADPAGGYYYVFMAGRPAFQKYDALGNLVFERLLQGVEIDSLLASQPTEWPRRVLDFLDDALAVTPSVRKYDDDASRISISSASPPATRASTLCRALLEAITALKLSLCVCRSTNSV